MKDQLVSEIIELYTVLNHCSCSLSSLLDGIVMSASLCCFARSNHLLGNHIVDEPFI